MYKKGQVKNPYFFGKGKRNFIDPQRRNFHKKTCKKSALSEMREMSKKYLKNLTSSGF